jgi:hypothetical protein
MHDKLKDISEKSTDDNLLYFHNVAMYLHKMDQIIMPPFCEYQELKIKDVYAKFEEITQTLKAAFASPSSLLKEEATPSVIIEKDASQSLKKDKMSWMIKKNELSSLNNDKNVSPKKLPSPRSPNILMKNPVTLREHNNSPKKESSYKFFHKDKSLKDKIGF